MVALLEFATGRHLYDPGHLRIEEVEARLSKEEREQALAASVASRVTELPPFAEDAIWCALAYRAEDVEHAAKGLPVPLGDILHTLLRRNSAERFATAAELETVMRARLAQLGPYAGEDVVREVQPALIEAGDRAPNGARAIASSTRHPDDVGLRGGAARLRSGAPAARREAPGCRAHGVPGTRPCRTTSALTPPRSRCRCWRTW